ASTRARTCSGCGAISASSSTSSPSPGWSRSTSRTGRCTRTATSAGSPTPSRAPSPAPCAERTDPFAIVAAMALLSGQVAIFTGAGRGLGRAVSETLAALGASVVLASRNAPELDEVVKGIKRSGGHALAQTADVADERQVQDLAL